MDVLGTDSEIMYISSINGIDWLNPIVILDGYNNYYWNTGKSFSPDITVDNESNIHAVWTDHTKGFWDNDTEILYLVSQYEYEDLIWDEIPLDQRIAYSKSFSYDINASDPTGITYYWINDTLNFDIEINGIITNNSILDVGIYWIEVRVYDCDDNYYSANIKITVFKSPKKDIFPILNIALINGALIGASGFALFYLHKKNLFTKIGFKSKTGPKKLPIKPIRGQNVLSKLVQENIIDNLSNIKGLKLTSFNRKDIAFIDQFQWDQNERTEFLYDLAFFSEKKRQKIFNELKFYQNNLN